ILRRGRRNLRQVRCVERFCITATQRHCANVLGIKRLPPHRHLWLLRVIPATRRKRLREKTRLQHCRGILAVPFFALDKVNLQTVEAGEVPRWTGQWHPNFLVDSPDVPVHAKTLPIRRADRLECLVQWVANAIEIPSLELTTDGE